MDTPVAGIIKRYALYLFLSWTAIVVVAFILYVYHTRSETIEMAVHEAGVHYDINKA